MKKKILVIDDELQLLENIQEILEMENYSVLTANNGLEGLRLIEKTIPDLIICDIMMPELDGFEVLGRLKGDPKYSEIPFIYLSAKVDIPDIKRGIQLGANDYLCKPFSIDALICAINDWT